LSPLPGRGPPLLPEYPLPVGRPVRLQLPLLLHPSDPTHHHRKHTGSRNRNRRQIQQVLDELFASEKNRGWAGREREREGGKQAE
jgi:hypothetical protein